MFIYKINYLINGEEKNILIDNRNIKFSIKKRIRYGPGYIFYLAYKHDKDEVLNNVLGDVVAELYHPDITEISVSLIDTENQTEDIIFKTNNIVVELDTNFKPDDQTDYETDLPFETIVRIG